MFFIGIFGIEHKEKVVKENKNFFCKECNLERKGRIIKSYDYFHFFFIPLFKWNISYYVICSNCNTIYELTVEKGKEIEKRNDDITYWDIKQIYNTNKVKVCPECKYEYESEFNYCPNCGHKLK